MAALIRPAWTFWLYVMYVSGLSSPGAACLETPGVDVGCSRGCPPAGRWGPPPVATACAGGSSSNDNNTSAQQQRQQGGGGRLGDACCRLLGALVLTTAMHPGTLMADLGAGPLQDGPTVRVLGNSAFFFVCGFPSVQCWQQPEQVNETPRKRIKLHPYS